MISDQELVELTARIYSKAWKEDIEKYLGDKVPSWEEMGNGGKAAMLRCAKVVLDEIKTLLIESIVKDIKEKAEAYSKNIL